MGDESLELWWKEVQRFLEAQLAKVRKAGWIPPEEAEKLLDEAKKQEKDRLITETVRFVLQALRSGKGEGNKRD